MFIVPHTTTQPGLAVGVACDINYHEICMIKGSFVYEGRREALSVCGMIDCCLLSCRQVSN